MNNRKLNVNTKEYRVIKINKSTKLEKTQNDPDIYITRFWIYPDNFRVNRGLFSNMKAVYIKGGPYARLEIRNH